MTTLFEDLKEGLNQAIEFEKGKSQECYSVHEYIEKYPPYHSAVYALKKFQEQMKGEAEKAGFLSEEDIADWIMSSRREENK